MISWRIYDKDTKYYETIGYIITPENVTVDDVENFINEVRCVNGYSTLDLEEMLPDDWEFEYSSWKDEIGF